MSRYSSKDPARISAKLSESPVLSLRQEYQDLLPQLAAADSRSKRSALNLPAGSPAHKRNHTQEPAIPLQRTVRYGFRLRASIVCKVVRGRYAYEAGISFKVRDIKGQNIINSVSLHRGD